MIHVFAFWFPIRRPDAPESRPACFGGLPMQELHPGRMPKATSSGTANPKNANLFHIFTTLHLGSGELPPAYDFSPRILVCCFWAQKTYFVGASWQGLANIGERSTADRNDLPWDGSIGRG